MKDTIHTASKPDTSAIAALAVRECAFLFRGFFAQPQPLLSIDLKSITDKFLSTFKEYNLTATDISFDRGDSLFGYSLKAGLFNGLVSFNVGAMSIEGTFSRLLRATDRRLAADCIKKLVEIFSEGLSEFCYFEIALHADFNSTKERLDFFSRKAQGGLATVGILGYRQLDDQQSIRLEIDQSYTFPDGAFIGWRTIGMKLAKLLSFDPIWATFFSLIEAFDLQLQDD
jgi:hypothetical protein